MPRPNSSDDEVDDVHDIEDSRATPTLYSIDKKLSVFTAEQRIFRASVDKRFDTVERRVEEFGTQYATKLEVAEAVRKIEKLEEKTDKFAAGVNAYGKWIILSFLGAIAGLVYKSGLIH